jgi:peptide/nickel transport system permease protein
VLTFVTRRVLIAIPLLWGVLTLVFLSEHLIPGDPASVMLYGRGSAQDVARLRHRLGLDRPLLTQYWDFLHHAVHLDFGHSIVSQQPVWGEIMSRFPATAELAATSMVLVTIFGLLSGVLAAVFNGRVLGTTITSLSVVGISVPDFALGTMLALIFGVKLGWLPVAGYGGLGNLILPSITLAAGNTAVVTRLARASLMDVLDMDYITTARAKGLHAPAVIYKHALKNALIPVVTIFGLTVAGLLGGVVITETVFAWPGLGTYAVAAVTSRDFPAIEGTTFFFAAILIVANLLVDISYALLDPRIHYR